MAGFEQYADYDGLGLAELVRRGEVAPGQVLEAAFSLIDRLNPRLNAIVRPMRREAERDAAGGLPDGRFKGVPIVLKDEYLSYAGVPNDQSSALAAGWARPYDTFLVQAYKAAGMLIIGKSNLPELGASTTTDARLYGPCRNPWDLTRNSGGSSGGSAAAVAAGIVPVAYGNDGAGSIRIPASCCGVFGLKPTRARVSTAPDGGEYWNGLVIEHALTRSVRDSAALLDATDQPQPGDCYRAPPKRRPFLEEVGTEPGRLRIAFSAIPPVPVDIAPDCVGAMNDAASLCESLGHHVEEARPEFDGAAMMSGIARLLGIHLAYGLDAMAEITGRKISPGNVESATLALAANARKWSAVDLLATLETFTSIARSVAPFWERYDALLTPTLAWPPVQNGFICTSDEDAERYLKRMLDFVPFTPLANVTGNPAMSVPLYWNAEGLPIGVQFIGRFGDEATLFRLAGQLEVAKPWRGRHPPVSAWSV